MLTPEQQNKIYRETTPSVENDLVSKGLRRDQAQRLAEDIVLSYIIECQDEPNPILPKHSYGIKIGPGKGIINLYLTFEPNAKSST